MKTAEDGYIPLKTRFLAWWEGVDPEFLMRQQKKKAGITSEPTPTATEEPVESAEDDSPDLDSLIAIREAVWGKGFVLPGGVDDTLSLVAPAELEEGNSVLCLGAGLGGGCRAVAAEWDVEVEGLEADGAVVEAAVGRIRTQAGAATISLRSYMPNNARLKVNRYDCVFGHEAFFGLMAKQSLLEKVWHSLKEDSHLLFTDLVYATTYASDEPDILEWSASEPKLSDIWTVEQYRHALTELHFSLEAVEDQSQWYLQLIRKKWLEFMDSLNTDKLDRKSVDLVMAEAQMWKMRIKALKSGHLRYVRVHAYRDLDKNIK